MALTTTQDKEVLATEQHFKGPNVAAYGFKNVRKLSDIRQSQDDFVAPEHSMLDLVGFVDPNTDTTYDTAPIGSTYTQLVQGPDNTVADVVRWQKISATAWGVASKRKPRTLNSVAGTPLIDLVAGYAGAYVVHVDGITNTPTIKAGTTFTVAGESGSPVHTVLEDATVAAGEVDLKVDVAVTADNNDAVTFAYPVYATDSMVVGDGTEVAFAVDLPPAADAVGAMIGFKSLTNDDVTITKAAGDSNNIIATTVAGVAGTFVLNGAGDGVILVCDGTYWYVLADYPIAAA